MSHEVCNGDNPQQAFSAFHHRQCFYAVLAHKRPGALQRHVEPRSFGMVGHDIGAMSLTDSPLISQRCDLLKQRLQVIPTYIKHFVIPS